MYNKLNIDVNDFYESKFIDFADFDFTKGNYKAFNVNTFKSFWIYSNVKEGSRVLDFGCGSGNLVALKNKNCEIVGVDYSKFALSIAKKNGYDEVFAGDILDFNYEEGSFDYVVSLDVFGHIPFEDKDKVLTKLKSLLAPGGTMLHGIECGQIDYDAMSDDELKSFVGVDGHVGIEGKMENINRFEKFFTNVEGEVRYVLVNSCDEYIKSYELYRNESVFPIYSFVKSLSKKERRVFDIAMGFSLINISNKGIESKKSDGGFLFLKASDSFVSSSDMDCNDPALFLKNSFLKKITNFIVSLKRRYLAEMYRLGLYKKNRK